MDNELKQFLGGLETDQQADIDPFAHVQPQDSEQEPQPEQKPEENEDAVMHAKNRRERRLLEKLEAERQSSIRLNEELRQEREARQRQEASEAGDYLKDVERIYGTESPEAREATEILKRTLLGLKESAKQEALQEIQQRQEVETRAVKEAESMLDDMVDEIEEVYGLALTEQQQSDFYRLLERMSPKDRDGNILYYADHIAVWEDYQTRLKAQTNTAARDLASRSMTNSGSAPSQNADAEATERYLRENGII